MTGIAIVDKPAGWTSHDVVARLRRALGEKRIGHGGTLDPMATGVLPIFVGRATRAASFLESADKEYLASVRFGLTTDTQDTTGQLLSESALRPSGEEVEAALLGFLGPQEQLPPLYSAVKVDGRKLYQYARAGREVERRPRQIEISAVEPLGFGPEGDYRFRLTVSKGTYVRTLCHDLGQRLGCGAAMSSLRRLRAGAFTAKEASPLEAFLDGEGARLLRPLDSLFRAYPAMKLEAGQARRCRCGNSFAADAPDGIYRLYDGEGAFLALAEAASGTVRTIKSFFEV
jgi:tRNA pseudouridine55 synthase